MQLEGKVAIVTGGGGNIGSTTCALLASRGAVVIVADRYLENARHVAAEISATGASAVPFVVDLLEELQIQALIGHAVSTFGHLDILVNNAVAQSFGNDRDIESMETAVWDLAFAVNARGTMLCCKYALAAMSRRQSASIINVASNLALQGHIFQAAYSSSKAAILQMTRSIAASHGRRGIRCNAVSPGLIAADPANSPIPESIRMSVAAETLNGRLGECCEIAAAIAFLASDEAAHITGQNLVVDGGNSAHVPGFAQLAGPS